MPSVSYTPQFSHQDWVDNVDRVQAGGANGFNGRFHSLEAEFQRLSQVLADVGAALDALGTKPPPAPTKVSLTPILVTSGAVGWSLVNGFALKQPGQTGAHGIMQVNLPTGATIQSFRASGQNSGGGSLRVAIQRLTVGTDATSAQRISRVDGVGAPFDTTAAADAQFAVVDNEHFRYFVTADLDNAGANDTVQINAFQIAILAS
jgi:hypothetical protein